MVTKIGLPYSIDIRLDLISHIAQGTFVEIGGDDPEEFHNGCSSFSNHLNLDINDSSAELTTIHDLEEVPVDVVAHYDVLEHVADVKEFLAGCHRALTPGGVMICEMPDIRLYLDLYYKNLST